METPIVCCFSRYGFVHCEIQLDCFFSTSGCFWLLEVIWLYLKIGCTSEWLGDMIISQWIWGTNFRQTNPFNFSIFLSGLDFSISKLEIQFVGWISNEYRTSSNWVSICIKNDQISIKRGKIRTLGTTEQGRILKMIRDGARDFSMASSFMGSKVQGEPQHSTLAFFHMPKVWWTPLTVHSTGFRVWVWAGPCAGRGGVEGLSAWGAFQFPLWRLNDTESWLSRWLKRVWANAVKTPMT